MNQMNLVDLVLHASPVVQAIMLILSLMSVVSWGLMISLSQKLNHTADFDERFWAWYQAQPSIHDCHHSIDSQSERTGLEIIVHQSYQDFKTLPTQDAVNVATRQNRAELGRQQSDLEKGLSTIASISSVAPYVGLLGTVWGIMHAFIGLSDATTLTLATVAPAIAEALIATALGLFAAIPASLGFNHFSTKANWIYEQRVLFCDDMTAKLIKQMHPNNFKPHQSSKLS